MILLTLVYSLRRNCLRDMWKGGDIGSLEGEGRKKSFSEHIEIVNGL